MKRYPSPGQAKPTFSLRPMSVEYRCSRCGFVGPKNRGQLIDWIAAILGTIFRSPGHVEVLRDLISPPCPGCRKLEPPESNTV